MPDFRLRIGMLFQRQGRIYAIDRLLPDHRLGLKDLLSGESSAIEHRELIKELFDGKLELLGDDARSESRSSHWKTVRLNDLSQLAEDDPLRLEIMRRSRYVDHVLADSSVRRTKESLARAIRTVSESIGDRRPPSPRTLYRWLQNYEASGHDVRALQPVHSARGNRSPKVSGARLDRYGQDEYEKARVIDGLIDQVVRTRYLSANRPTVSSVYESLQARILDENRLRAGHDRLPIPHLSSLYRRISRIDPYEAAAARHGRKYANQQYRVNRRGPRPSHPLERVECDHTRLDLMVVDAETRLPLGRPWLTALLDIYSRMVLGVHLSFHPPGYLSVMQCLRHAIRPKDYLKAVYPEIEHDWPAYGLPELLVTDNGKEFRSRHLDDACLQLGIKLQHAPPKCPWYKGAMERWFGTQNTRLLHELPGTTFSDIFDRGDYDPRKHAVISFDALLEITHTWVVDLYHQQVQSGIGDLPDRRWRTGVVDWPPNLPRCAEDMNVLIGCVAQRKIGNSGIQLFALHYNSSELGLIRRHLKAGEMARIKYDPADLSMIHVLDPDRGQYLPVPAIEEQYTQRLTLWQHRIIRRYARRSVSRHLDLAALCRARERIEQIVAHERVVQKRLTGRQKAARFLNLSQPDYDRRRKDARETAQGHSISAKAAGERIPTLLPPSTMADLRPERPLWSEPDGQAAPAPILDLMPEQSLTIDEEGWGIEYRFTQREGGRR